MAWIYLIVAGLLEVGWAVGIRYSQGFTRFWPSLWTILAMLLSVYFLAQALRQIPIGTGYAVWTGIGTVGVAIFGMALLGESHHWARVLCIGLIVGGIAGLKILTPP